MKSIICWKKSILYQCLSPDLQSPNWPGEFEWPADTCLPFWLSWCRLGNTETSQISVHLYRLALVTENFELCSPRISFSQAQYFSFTCEILQVGLEACYRFPKNTDKQIDTKQQKYHINHACTYLTFQTLLRNSFLFSSSCTISIFFSHSNSPSGIFSSSWSPTFVISLFKFLPFFPSPIVSLLLFACSCIESW